MGTPNFALPSLTMLVDEGYLIAGVFSQPDRPRGRGHKLLPTPVKELAESCGLPVFQFEKVSREEGIRAIKGLSPNLIVTAAFGQILSRELLAIPEFGCINVHGSLLPKYRGAAPIQWAIINGERATGVTTMFTRYELDAGDMLVKREVKIAPESTGGELYELLSEEGALALKETLELLIGGELKRVPQQESEASYYPIPGRELGRINFSKTCLEIKNLVRALNPAPAAYAMLGRDKIKIYKAVVSDLKAQGKPGTVVLSDPKKGLFIQAGDGVISLEELQLPGSKRMRACDLLRGKQIETGVLLNGEE